MKFSTTLRTARANAIITAAGTNPKIKFYNGTESLTPAGVLTVTDASIVPSTLYRIVLVLGSGAEGMDKVTAT